ncbi:hypothetical protein HanHA89_Chr01g0017041 [Helianthus annuus]|nr:hypothetical protein HanHA89_Chr01g0017041 [Helianthus annuus]
MKEGYSWVGISVIVIKMFIIIGNIKFRFHCIIYFFSNPRQSFVVSFEGFYGGLTKEEL